MGIEATSGLRVLAINILGRFLSNRDNNIRYVALNILMKAVAVDSQAVQRHRATIVECVKDSDASIRHRALELVFLLVNDTNVKQLSKELIDYLEVSDQEFKGELSSKICSIVEKFSSEKLWYIDQMLKVLSEAGNYVKDDVWHALIVLISNSPDLQGYTVRSLYKAFQTSSEQESLVRVAIWCIGEYGDMLVNGSGLLEGEEPVTVTESDAVDVIETSLKSHASDITTQAMSLVALLKLSSRFPLVSERISELIMQQKGNLVLELQQRSIEFGSIIEKHQTIKSSLVERMPVLDESTYIGKRTGSSTATHTSNKTTKPISSGTSLNLPNGVNKVPAAPLVDLLDLSSDDAPVPSLTTTDFLHDLLGVDLTSSTSSGAALIESSDILMDLLSIGTSNNDLPSPNMSSSQSNIVPLSPLERLSSTSSLTSQVPNHDPLKEIALKSKSPTVSSPVMDLLDGLSSPIPIQDENPVFPSITAFESNALKITFSFKKQPSKPQVTVIQATFMNMSSNAYTDFIFQAAVPKFVQLQLDPASSNVLPANSTGPITQTLTVTNNQHGQKALAMRIRIAYKVNNQDKLEQGQINNFPSGL
ncbi:AP-1 complex subunit gamma-2-like [Iris pallida]|nr:AP-1 complex subunit gamma-2-like [Iris pallida]